MKPRINLKGVAILFALWPVSSFVSAQDSFLGLWHCKYATSENNDPTTMMAEVYTLNLNPDNRVDGAGEIKVLYKSDPFTASGTWEKQGLEVIFELSLAVQLLPDSTVPMNSTFSVRRKISNNSFMSKSWRIKGVQHVAVCQRSPW